MNTTTPNTTTTTDATIPTTEAGAVLPEKEKKTRKPRTPKPPQMESLTQMRARIEQRRDALKTEIGDVKAKESELAQCERMLTIYGEPTGSESTPKRAR